MSNFSQGQGDQGVARRRTNGTSHKQSRRSKQRLQTRAIYGCELAISLARNFTYSFSPRPYSDILFASDRVNWVLHWEMLEVARIVRKLGIRARALGTTGVGFPRQCVFFPSKYILRYPRRYLSFQSRVAFPYFHGHPASGNIVAVECYQNLKRFHRKICRIQVSHSRMRDLILSTGISPSKVFLIPIGINPDFFHKQNPASRKAMRHKYGIPQHATVVGSFQKDGVGWGEGNVAKLIKGPDVFLKALAILKDTLNNIFVLLSGPARGYVKRGLERLKIPYRHIYLKEYPQVGELFQCLDVYIVASREEGGPKAVLESMASGVPLVTTSVGQATDLVRHGENAWMVDVEDAEGLAHWTEKALTDTVDLQEVLTNGVRTAKAHAYEAQMGRWKEFFQGFVETG